MEFLKKIKWNIILESAVVALLGLIVIVNPEAAALSVCLLAGWFLIIGGGLTLGAYFAMGKSRYMLITALIQLVPGVFIVIRPDVLVSFVSVLLGVLLLIYGIACLREGVEDKKLGYRHWWLNLIIGIATVVLAAVVVINPFAASSTVMIFAGAAMLLHGIGNIITVAVISQDMKKMM